MSNYLKRVFGRPAASSPVTVQTKENQIKNEAGGYVYGVDPMTMLRRFLVLGTEGGNYYAGEQAITRENATNVEALIKADGLAVVREIVAISEAGRAPKNDPALFA